MTNHFQTIVIGAGSLGSSAAYWLTKAGYTDVLVLEQDGLGHDGGSHGDHSRIIRHSYHDNVYGQLTSAMYDNWARLEADSGQRVYVKTGGLDLAVPGTPGEGSLMTYRKVMSDSGISFEPLGKRELLERYPQWELKDDVVATFQEDSGLIDIRRATLTHLGLAQANGATVLTHSLVRAIEDTDDRIRVITDVETYTAETVVVCAGSWTDELLKPLGQTWSTTITEEQVLYVQSTHLRDFAVGRFPVWAWHGDDLFYGFPAYGEPAAKIARENLTRIVTQRQRSPIPHDDENEVLRLFLRDHLPGADGPILYAKTCPYDLPPDRNFIIDSLPSHPRVFVGAGAAHAGKFAGLIGEILADLVTLGHTNYPIGAFSATRPALSAANSRLKFSLQR